MNDLFNHTDDAALKDEVPTITDSTLPDPAISFATALKRAGGKFIYCSNHKEFIILLNKLLKENLGTFPYTTEEHLLMFLEQSEISCPNVADEKHQALLTTCEALLAPTGGVIFSDQQYADGKHPHLVVADVSGLCESISEVMARINEKHKEKSPEMLYFINARFTQDKAPTDMSRYYIFMIDYPPDSNDKF